MMENTSSTLSKGAVFKKDWTKGSIIQNILLLSWPMIVLNALYSANLILEMVWVGKLGAASIAGVGVSGFVVLWVISIKGGIGAGERALIARFIGAGDVAAANHTIGQALVIAFTYGGIVTLAGIFLTVPILSLFGLEQNALAEGSLYLRVVLIGWFTESFWMTSLGAMQASGDSMTPLKAAIVLRIVNAALCPFLVLGWWIFPRLGVTGAGLTYVISTGLGMVITLWIFFTGKTRLRLTLRDLRPDLKFIWRILKIGIPSSVMGLGKTFGDLIITSIIVPFGTLPLAAHNLIARIETFVNTTGLGLSNGAGVLVGQNLGVGQPRRASRSGWLALALVEGFMIICLMVLLIWSANIIGIFNVQSDLLQLGVTFLRIAVAGYLGMAAVNVLQACISGSGDTLPPMIISMATLWLVQFPLAFLLSRFTGLGVYGVRWALVIGFFVGAIAYLIYFWLGRWKRKKV
jgi:putative MATE family efflux protein